MVPSLRVDPQAGSIYVNGRLKRCIDIGLSGVGLVVLFPVLLILGALVALRLGRPILFRQQRPGRHGRPFELLKFRTMTDQRDSSGRLLDDSERLTDFGRWLRSTSLDELPELINVFRGEMSLVGPRPLLMRYLDRYSAEQFRRHAARPGLTGWAQVNGRNALDWAKRFELDLWYVDHAGLSTDLLILARTILAVLKREGVSGEGVETMSEFMGDSPRRIFLSPPDVGASEREALLHAFDSGYIAPVGPELSAFESEMAELLGSDVHCAALASGTAGIHLGLEVLGVQPGDRVIAPTFSFAATANPVRYLGAEPVFVDAELDSWNASADAIGEALEACERSGSPVRAVIVADVYGRTADYARIREVCDAHGVPLLQDAAEAVGATWQSEPAGLQGDIGVYSFNGNKLMTTSGGGMLISRNAEYVQRARHLATQAREPGPFYEHREVGYNYRLSNLLAGLGRAQLARLPEFLRARRRVNETYQRLLADCNWIQWMPEAPFGKSNHWLTCLLLPPTFQPVQLVDMLAASGIESRPLWKPLHLQESFAGSLHFGPPNSEQLFKRGIALPSGSTLTEADQIRICKILGEWSVKVGLSCHYVELTHAACPR